MKFTLSWLKQPEPRQQEACSLPVLRLTGIVAESKGSRRFDNSCVGPRCRGARLELPCKRIQVDEIWAYVGKKQAQLRPQDDRARLGDMWTFVAIDPCTGAYRPRNDLEIGYSRST